MIGVHCTHGVNRTGYMVCCYMISKLGFAPDQAIAGETTTSRKRALGSLGGRCKGKET